MTLSPNERTPPDGRRDIGAPPPRAVLWSAIVFEGALAVVALAIAWLWGLAPLEQTRFDLRSLGTGFVATLPLWAALWAITRYPIGPFGELKRLVETFVVPLFRSLSLLELALISALAGIGEELLFRGVLQEGLASTFGRPWLALLAASLLFGAVHWISTTYAAVATAIGLYLGWLLMRTENLAIPVIVHALYDFGALVYLLHGGRQRGGSNVPLADPSTSPDGPGA